MTKPDYILLGVGVLVLSVVSVCWLRDHDARIRAEQHNRESDARIATLEQDKAAALQAGKEAKAALQKKAAEVKTPAQAIAAIPDMSDIPLSARPLPDMPTAVAVEALPLFQELNKCKQNAVDLGTCQLTYGAEQKENAELKGQVETLKKAQGGGFFQRMKRCAVRGGIGAGAGGMFGGQKGLIGGAALGFGSCLVVKP